MLLPVSYTHLDVYKRQVIGCEGDGQSEGEQHNAGELARPDRMLDVAILLLLERFAAKCAGDEPKDEEIKRKAGVPREPGVQVHVAELGDQHVKVWIVHRHVMKRLFHRGGVIGVGGVFRSGAMVTHPLIELSLIHI